MKLTRLELTGFKSFADTITLDFESGVTAIVGPNGCGKSNVSDAVRWVLGEQSARILRGGKMEDVIFQGTATRRPVNVAEVSLYIDNSDGQLPTPYTEVVITRRLSRSGQSDYLLNNSVVRLRDVQDLLRGTGLGGNAGVVIEAKLIDLLLSDRPDDRRVLFEEAAGIGLYRDRRHATARRLEDTAGDLQRLQDLMAEVQSHIRSLARQKGKAERHHALSEERFAVTVALTSRRLERLAADSEEWQRRHAELEVLLPRLRELRTAAESGRESAAIDRDAAERHRTAVADDLAAARLELGKLEGELAVNSERLSNATERLQYTRAEQVEQNRRREQAVRELEAANDDHRSATAAAERIGTELKSRSDLEASGRDQVTTQRTAVRGLEQRLQQHAEQLRQLAGEVAALDAELATLLERIEQETAHRSQLESDREAVESQLAVSRDAAAVDADAARRGRDRAEEARLMLRECRDRDAREALVLRAAEQELASLSARRDALEALERDRVGIAPAAAALLSERDRFGTGIIGTLADSIGIESGQAELAERLLGEALHAILVRDQDTVTAIEEWHRAEQPGTLILLPIDPGPKLAGGEHADQLSVDPIARSWVNALVAGVEPLSGPTGVRRADGSIWLTATAAAGPLRRRAELEQLGHKIGDATGIYQAAEAVRAATRNEITELEESARALDHEAITLRESAHASQAARQDLERRLNNLIRELGDTTAQVERLEQRRQRATVRHQEATGLIESGAQQRLDFDAMLGEARTRLVELEAAQEQALEARSEWQVQEAHVMARLHSASGTVERSRQTIADAETATRICDEEIKRLEAESQALSSRLDEGRTDRDSHATSLQALETAAGQAGGSYQAAHRLLEQREAELSAARTNLDSANEEHHRLAIAVTEARSERKRIVDRVEAEWKKSFEELVEIAPTIDGDLDLLEEESERINSTLEAIGIVNPLAMEEHQEESTRLEFLQTQHDDLVAARQKLLQAIREIDGTAKALFLETFNAVRANFTEVFQTLFGGGECDLRLTDPDDPLESGIDIHAAPRGKRTQRIHLLSSGERTLVASSLLFSIYLTKPSPFCLMDEVDAPLDDANVGRFLRMLDEFKARTQFIVITHNPRTMQSADNVYGVTMQNPGVSTIVGVRLSEHVDAA